MWNIPDRPHSIPHLSSLHQRGIGRNFIDDWGEIEEEEVDIFKVLKIEVRLGQALRFVFDIKCIHFIFFLYGFVLHRRNDYFEK